MPQPQFQWLDYDNDSRSDVRSRTRNNEPTTWKIQRSATISVEQALCPHLEDQDAKVYAVKKESTRRRVKRICVYCSAISCFAGILLAAVIGHLKSFCANHTAIQTGQWSLPSDRLLADIKLVIDNQVPVSSGNRYSCARLFIF
jgi:hypothetical protein